MSKFHKSQFGNLITFLYTVNLSKTTRYYRIMFALEVDGNLRIRCSKTNNHGRGSPLC